MTDVQVTQEGIEAWVTGDPAVRVTQLGIEAWVVPIPPSVVASQIGIEAWVSVAAAPSGGPIISLIM